MRAVVQRVCEAAVYLLDGPAAPDPGPPDAPEPQAPARTLLGRIGRGFAVLVGVHVDDTPDDARTLAGRVATLRIFGDAAGRLNRSVLDVGGEVLSISQFTLYADPSGGRRPSFIAAAPPERAEPLYQAFNEHLAAAGVRVVPGRFRAHMLVEIHNDGPVTIILDAGPRGGGRGA